MTVFAPITKVVAADEEGVAADKQDVGLRMRMLPPIGRQLRR
jgi:hypothetical protein